MKYITYINEHDASDIRIFSTMEEHKKVASQMGDVEILGAGFIDFTVPECYGYSDSMDMNSRGVRDTKILKIFIKLSKREGECHAE